MDQQLVAEVLTSDSDEIAEIRTNLTVLENFTDLARQIDSLPETSNRFFEESRSLYQATITGRNISDLETLLAKFFGPPVKEAGGPLPRKMRKNSTVKYLGGLQKDQSLFLVQLKNGEFYGALWPWQRNKNKIEIHLGYCSDWITDEDYMQLETMVKRSMSHSTFQKMDAHVGGRIHGISIPSFMQMAEMEQSSFCLDVISGENNGRLFLKDGILLDAETEDMAGCQAAYRIISWENASIEILPAEEDRPDNIHQPLMHVLMESLKIKDELTSTLDKPPVPPKPKNRPAKSDKKPKRLVRLERAPAPRQPRKRGRIAFLFAICLLLAAAAGAAIMFGPELLNSGAADAYQKLLTQVEDAGTLENKIVLFENYLQTRTRSPHTAEIQSRIEDLQNQLAESDFQQITLHISSIPIDEQYERKAIDLYSGFLEKYPGGSHSKRINQAIAEIKNLIDQYYYEELKRAARLDFGERLKTYRNYLARFPEGRYNQDVDVLIQEMGRKYFEYLKSEAIQCEQNSCWESHISRLESFSENYAGTMLGDQALQLGTELSDKRDLSDLRRIVEEAGTDYQKAYQACKDYLSEHADSTQQQVIKDELARLEQYLSIQRKWKAVYSYAVNPANGILERIRKVTAYVTAEKSSPYSSEALQLKDQLENERLMTLQKHRIETKRKEELVRLRLENERLAQQREYARQLQNQIENQLRGSTRFKPHGNGTVTDLSTGLTWSTLDSHQELGGCINYQNAIDYVRVLNHGGFTDWRLPTASELASIYKQEPFFPAGSADWYWTSEAYAKGYHSVVDIVTAKPETVFKRDHRTQEQCGAAKAVRP